jgi:hypothetical protein
MTTTYEQLHAGAIVLGGDGEPWGVEQIDHEPQLAVTLVRLGQRVTGYPPLGTPVTVIDPADVRAEEWAAQVLIDAFGSVQLIGERWEA